MTRLAPVLPLLMLGLLACAPGDDPGIGDQPNVVLISLDTLGAKHLGCYGYHRETSPNIDALAGDSILFMNAYASSAKTAESHMSMFTSLHPSVHGVWTRADKNKVVPLGPAVPTLAEMLQGAGYETVGFHGGGFVHGRFGFDRGFLSYEQAPHTKAQEWLKKNGWKKKFFLFYHTYHVHDPYTPKPPFDTMFDPDYRGEIIHDRGLLLHQQSKGMGEFNDLFWERVDKDDPADVEHLVALYDGAIRELDTRLAELFETIDRHAPNTIVILLSDHGEEFGEHGEFLHHQLYDEILRVPLIIRQPGGPRGVAVDERVSLIDLTPTILAMLDLPQLDHFQGRPLLDSRSGLTAADREVFSELPTWELTSLIEEDRKIMLKKDVWEFFDLAGDPGELNDLNNAPEPPQAFVALRNRLSEYVAGNAGLAEVFAGTEEETLSEETLEQMRSLGYID